MKIQSGKPTDRNISTNKNDNDASSAVEDLFALLFANMVTGQQMNMQTVEQPAPQSTGSSQEDKLDNGQNAPLPALNNQAPLLNMLTQQHNSEEAKPENTNKNDDIVLNELLNDISKNKMPVQNTIPQDKPQKPVTQKLMPASSDTKNITKDITKDQIDKSIVDKLSANNNPQQDDSKANLQNPEKDKLNLDDQGINLANNQLQVATITTRTFTLDGGAASIQQKPRPEMQSTQYLSNNPVEPVIQLELTRHEVSFSNNKSNYEYNLTVKVHPAELGEVTARIETGQHNSNLFLIAENSHVKDIMLASIGQLKSELSNSGIQINQVHVDINDSSRFQQDMQQSSQQQASRDDEVKEPAYKAAVAEDKKTSNIDLLIDTYA